MPWQSLMRHHPYIGLAFIYASIGALISLAALLPPIRRLARSSSTARIGTLVGLGLLSLAVPIGSYTRLKAVVFYAYHAYFVADIDDLQGIKDKGSIVWLQEENKPAIINEVWMRLLGAGLLHPRCRDMLRDR